MGRAASFEGPPPGPPGRRSFPLVTGRAATCLPLGVGLETELGGSPALVWMVLLLYVSTLEEPGSFTTLTVASFPGFLLYSMLHPLAPLVNHIRAHLLVSDLNVQLSMQRVREVGEKFRLEHAVHQGVRLLGTNDEREPVILEVGCADTLNGANGYRPLRRDNKLSVDEILCDDDKMAVGLCN